MIEKQEFNYDWVARVFVTDVRCYITNYLAVDTENACRKKQLYCFFVDLHGLFYIIKNPVNNFVAVLQLIQKKNATTIKI